MFEGKKAAGERLAQGKGGTGDFAGDIEGVGEAANPFRFTGTERAVEAENCPRPKMGKVASGVGAGGGGIRTDFSWGKFSGGGHSRGGGGRRCGSLGLGVGRCRWG